MAALYEQQLLLNIGLYGYNYAITGQRSIVLKVVCGLQWN